ncbi:hypothetical protein BCR34DRAFT_18243 [Clohesyomyces aquaticus]|uniref:Uncharacterized protein n=1 Tax=Clohesyomyces aquaticus TaxID=1231657 RepID=A0A1Y1ZBP8_9PLEO|nr:hypothetical protein BCR34DRAFT_18243 [Clohesyomyces aquaticus]
MGYTFSFWMEGNLPYLTEEKLFEPPDRSWIFSSIFAHPSSLILAKGFQHHPRASRFLQSLQYSLLFAEPKLSTYPQPVWRPSTILERMHGPLTNCSRAQCLQGLWNTCSVKHILVTIYHHCCDGIVTGFVRSRN